MAYGSTACLCIDVRFGIGVTNTLVRNVHSLYQSVGHTPFDLSPRLLLFAFSERDIFFWHQVDPDAPLYRPTYVRHTLLNCIYKLTVPLTAVAPSLDNLRSRLPPALVASTCKPYAPTNLCTRLRPH